MLPFHPGLELTQRFYESAVRPIIEVRFPRLVYSAARLGHGSDVLGYDTEQSMDHEWGLRLTIFLPAHGFDATRTAVDQALRAELPSSFMGYPLSMAWIGAQAPPFAAGEALHRVDLMTVAGFCREHLGADPSQGWGVAEWLAAPEQALLSLTSGRVFHDGLGALDPLRRQLAYYPPDVWLYLLSAQWRRIGQEEPFMGRCGQVGDELGSRLVAARLVRDLMRLGFLMEWRYAPYIKWFGSAYQRLPCAGRFLPLFEEVLRAETWPERERPLVAALEEAARLHNELGLTPRLDTQARPFYDRPFRVIGADRFAAALRDEIRDSEVLALPDFVGGIDQWADSTDVLSYPDRFMRLRHAFD